MKNVRSRKKRSLSKKRCKSLLADKIKINISEYKSGRWVSIPQAVAVSYSQIKKWYPSCKNKLRRKSKIKSRRKSRRS